MAKQSAGIETLLIHAGEPKVRVEGAVTLPVFQSSTFEYAGQQNYHDLKYIRLNNTPNHLAVQEKLAAIEGGDAAVVTGSGMAAITTSLLGLLKTGDHLLVQNCLYGGTYSFVTRDLPSLGIEFDFIDGNNFEDWEKVLRAETRAIYVETMTNPLLEVAALEGVVQFARERGLISIIDNTFASPVNYRPLEVGFDLSIHSCTKYLNGHSDIVAGCVIGQEHLVGQILYRLNHLGGCLDPHACFLLHRGLKTLALRIQKQNENALCLAQFLEGHPCVQKVNYPGLESHPQHACAKEWFDGYSGVLSFEAYGDAEVSDRLISYLKLPISAPSLGGVETLITRPATTSHAGLSAEERKKIGIEDRLLRVAVGIEDVEDLCADFGRGLNEI